MGALAGLIDAPLLLAHGGIPGLIAETGSVFLGLAIFGFFIRRSAKKEKQREESRDKTP